MSKFTPITATSLAEDEVLFKYLKNSKILPGNKGGTFVGNYEVAPDDFRKYGIVLKNGGMILPDMEPAELEAVLQEKNVAEQKRQIIELQKELDEWKDFVEREILPSLRGRLIEEVGTDCNIKIYAPDVKTGPVEPYIYAKVYLDGYTDGYGDLRALIDYSPSRIPDLEDIMAKLEKGLPGIKMFHRNQKFLVEQEERRSKFQSVIDTHTQWGVKWKFRQKGKIEIPGQDDDFIVHYSGDKGELVATDQTPEELQASLAPLRSAADDRARNEARVSSLAELVKKADIVLPDNEVAFNEEKESCFFVRCYDTHLTFNGKSFYWNDEGVNALEAEINAVNNASDKLKSEIRSLVEKGERITSRPFSIKCGCRTRTRDIFYFNGEVLDDYKRRIWRYINSLVENS
ncbi:MAG: hypothetical protein KKB03_03870 [Nanoarchaeota archaeon]|nr:hypothetical protein [Nanoarchaeota archaeon]MBU2520352.1 hypothetical protein [Nanoarchaeota archaeon]